MSAIPTDTKVGDLFQAQKAAIEDIAGVEADNVIIGEITHLDLRAKPGGFPCFGMVYMGSEGGEYIDQRNLRISYRFQLQGHVYVTQEQRDDGTDMIALSNMSSAVLRKLYGFIDDFQAGNPPCPGFLFTEGNYVEELYYQYFDENINTFTIDISYLVDTPDIET